MAILWSNIWFNRFSDNNNIFFAQRRRKQLSYEIISLSSVVNTSDEVNGIIQILFQGKPVSKVYLLIIKITNIGNVPITTNDYEREVSIKFGEGVKVLTADISATSPSNLNAEISSISDNFITLKSILLNNGDTYTIKMLISNFENKIVIDGRIVGIKLIENRTNRKIINRLVNFFSVLFIGTVLLSILLMLSNIFPDLEKFANLTSKIVAIIMLATLLVLTDDSISEKVIKRIKGL